MRKPTLCLWTLAACFATGCVDDSTSKTPPNQREVTKQQFGEEWPLSVERGILVCEPIRAVVLMANGHSFAVNGTAKSGRYESIDSIWRYQPAYAFEKAVKKLSEEQRRDVFAAIVACEDEAPGLHNPLADACKSKLRRTRRLTETEFDHIADEGVANSWPPLPRAHVNISPLIEAGLKLCQ